MSKKCCETEDFFDKQDAPGSPNESFSSKKRLSRCRRKASRGRSPSSRGEKKSKRKNKGKKSDFDSAKSSLTSVRSSKKKSRIESSANSDTTNAEVFASGAKKRRKKKKRQEAKRKKIENKKKKRTGRRKKPSESSVASRLIELLLKCCSCLKSFDSPTSTLSNDDNKCCCKCRFCRPDCENKFVQCDDCDYFVTSRHEPRDSRNVTNEQAGVSWEYLADEESNRQHLKIEDYGSDIRRKEDRNEKKKINDRTRKHQHKSDLGLCRSICKRFSALRNCEKRRVSTKSLIEDRNLLENNLVAFDSSSKPSTSKKIDKTIESDDKHCGLACKCDAKNRSKSTKALLIMFDIVFWPYTCLPGKRRSFDDKNKKK